MEAHTNPAKQPGLRQPDFATAADLSRGFAEQRERCRNLPAVHDGAQWAELSDRMGVFDGKLENLDCKVQNLDTKVQNLDTKIQHLEANTQRLEAKVDARMGALETEIKTLQTNMTTLETNIINKLDTLMALMTARFTEVDEKSVKCNKKIDAVRKNTSARLDNRMSGLSDPLWPLYEVETGEQINLDSRDALDGLTHALKAQQLTELPIMSYWFVTF
ncbi:hypothetical protein E4U58_003859 [Claviceps cyperi]|nr:hypothetical protein E4U58_003859 [Claviceps cyperi]